MVIHLIAQCGFLVNKSLGCSVLLLCLMLDVRLFSLDAEQVCISVDHLWVVVWSARSIVAVAHCWFVGLQFYGLLLS